MRRVGPVVAGTVAAVAAVIGGVTLLLAPEHSGDADAGGPSAVAPTAVTKPAAVARPVVLRPDPADACGGSTRAPFTPVRISVEDVSRGSTVLSLPRDAAGVPGVPPLTSAGKEQFAFDEPGIHPGEPRGNVILNAHTWPDGSAMGNRLLAGLDEGERLTLYGAQGEALCYRVTERLEVPESDPPLERVYDTDGRPQVVIIVCSGTRLGPGVWTHRTLWFASPAG